MAMQPRVYPAFMTSCHATRCSLTHSFFGAPKLKNYVDRRSGWLALAQAV
jgi:hypothetical protein